MELIKKFRDTTSCRIIHIGQMEVEHKYPIVRAERVYTRYGETILISIRDSQSQLNKVFLPQRYGKHFTNNDISSINEEKIKPHLIYKGKCVKTNSHMLDIE
jgi:hypothetical protein